MREMKEKFGAEVQSFRYSFVLPNHGSEWDGAHTLDPDDARAMLARARAASPAAHTAQGHPPAKPMEEMLPTPRRRATDKQPTFIEVKPRS
jgi:hypothetical protein